MKTRMEQINNQMVINSSQATQINEAQISNIVAYQITEREYYFYNYMKIQDQPKVL